MLYNVHTTNIVFHLLMMPFYFQWLKTMAALKKLFTRSDKKSKGSGSEQISEIGAPFGISHNIHVGFDNDAGTFVGLPPAWQEWLKKSNIT